MNKQQQGILVRVIVGFIIALGAIIIPLMYPIFLPISSMAVLCLSLIIPTFTYILGIGRIGNLRFFNEDIINPITQQATPTLIEYSQYLSNTLEQLVLAVITYVILSFVLPTGNIYLLLILSICFGIGRILFMVGYSKGAVGRALGFTLTFYPTILGLLIGVIILIATL